VKLKFLGAAGTVTGSRSEIEYQNKKYSVDFGLFQGPKDIREQNWNSIQEASSLESVLLTHAHIDHSGLLPVLVKNGFRGSIICSQATADLCRLLLPDSGHLQEEDARFANLKGYSSHKPAEPLYSQNDAIECLKYLSPQPMDCWIPLGEKLRYRLSPSGHILGSSFIELGYDHWEKNRILTFSGDLGQPNSLLLKDPRAIFETDELVLESTYGDRCHEKGDRFEQLAKIVNQVLGRKGTLVIPAFSVGRSQELLFMLRRLEDKGMIDSYPVYLDSPMALDATDLYKKYQDELRPEILNGEFISPIATGRFHAVRSGDESMLLCMDDSPKIVISAAGMLTGGRVLHHLKKRLSESKNGVLFVGYQVPGSKGYLLKNGLSRIRLHHQDIDVEAQIFSMESLSAHVEFDRPEPAAKYFPHD
jgi:metallo-beta-lactamase family protein